MPRNIEVLGVLRSVATEEELLAFANSIRQAGGAGVIEALLPSSPGNSSKCLIANALNFGCDVTGDDGGSSFADGSGKWIMNLPSNLTDEQRKALGSVQGVRLRVRKGSVYYNEPDESYLTLPKHIGNAALAFDYGVAFRDFVDPVHV